MSDLNYHWCRRCHQPEYACDCGDDADTTEFSLLQLLLRYDARLMGSPFTQPILVIKGGKDANR
jgi:hypothetical protein